MGDLDLVAKAREVLSNDPTIRLGLLFGSRARGGHDESSDLDIAIDGHRTDVLELARLLSEVCKLEVDIADLDSAGIPLLNILLSEAILLYEDQPGTYASWRSKTIAQLETDLPSYQRMRDGFLRNLSGPVSG